MSTFVDRINKAITRSRNATSTHGVRNIVLYRATVFKFIRLRNVMSTQLRINNFVDYIFF